MFNGIFCFFLFPSIMTSSVCLELSIILAIRCFVERAPREGSYGGSYVAALLGSFAPA